MSEQKQIPFDLEKFKAGQKAYIIEGKCFQYRFTTSEGRICVEYEKALPLCEKIQVYHLETLKKAHMVSRHQYLIDNYDPEDTWQYKNMQFNPIRRNWAICNGEPEWHEGLNYRLHPHNDTIKAWKKGAKIESYIVGDWVEEPNPDWYGDTQYRIKPEPVIHCLVYDAKRFNHEQTTAVRARVVKKEVAQANGWKIIQEWEV